MAAAASGPARLQCISLLSRFWQFRNTGKIRKNLSPCVKWTYCRYYSNTAPGGLKAQCLRHQHNSTFRSGHQWVSFCSSAKSLRAPHVSEPGSLPETPLVDPEKLAVDDLQNLFLEIHQELQTQCHDLQLLSNYYFDGKGKAFRPVIVVLMARALNSHIQGTDALMKSLDTMLQNITKPL